MAHDFNIIDKEPHFVIDATTRKITNELASEIAVVQFDHNSEVFTFSLPRWIENHDMTECNKVEIHYRNTDATSLAEVLDVYEVNDLQVDPADENKAVCTWLISQSATQKVGKLEFLVRFSRIADDGTILYAWNTLMFTGIMISPGLYNSKQVIEQYADVLEKWKTELFGASDEGVEKIYTARKSAVKEIDDTRVASVSAVTTEKNNAISDIEETHTTAINEIGQRETEVIDAVEQKAEETLKSIPEDYTKLNDNIEDIQTALGMTVCDGVTWRDGFWKIPNGTGGLAQMSETANSRCLVSEPIKVNKGDIVTFTSGVQLNTGALAVTDENETIYTAVVLGKNSNAVETYEYTATKSCYIVVACMAISEAEFSIKIKPTQSGEILDIKKNISEQSKKFDDYTKLNDTNISNIHTVLGITQFSGITWRESLWYINGNGRLSKLDDTYVTLYKLSEPIKVNVGDVVTLTSIALGSACVLATTNDPEATIYTPIYTGDNTLKTYEYTVENECYIAVSCLFDKTTNSLVEGFNVDIRPTKSKEVIEIQKDVAKLSSDIDSTRKSIQTPNFYGVKNGGGLTSSASGRKGTTTVEMLIKNERDETGWFYGDSIYLAGVYYHVREDSFRISLNVGNYEFVSVPQCKKGDISHIVIVYDDDEKSKTAYYNGVMIGKYANETYSVPSFNDKMLDGVVVYQKRIWKRALNADEVSRLYNNSFPTKYVLPESMTDGLISNLSCGGITDTGWIDTVTGQEIAFAEGVELYSVDEFSEYKHIKTLNEKMVQEQSVIKQNVYPDFEIKIPTARASHDCTFINGDFVSFNKPSDGYAVYINTDTWQHEKRVNINFTDNDYMGTPRELEMKSCDYKFGKLLVGNGRAIKHGETEYTQQGARLYVFHNADTWKAMTGQITLDNCGDYDVIDVSGLGYKIYGFWGQFDNCVFVSCNLFNDIYLIQLGKGAVNLGQGTYTECAEDRYNGSYMVINHWHQDGALGDWAGHGGQYYKGHLYIATNDASLCTIYKCILNHNGKLEFEALNFDVKDTTTPDNLMYRYIDGMCIKDDILYAQPLYVGTKTAYNNELIVAKM